LGEPAKKESYASQFGKTVDGQSLPSLRTTHYHYLIKNASQNAMILLHKCIFGVEVVLIQLSSEAGVAVAMGQRKCYGSPVSVGLVLS